MKFTFVYPCGKEERKMCPKLKLGIGKVGGYDCPHVMAPGSRVFFWQLFADVESDISAVRMGLLGSGLHPAERCHVQKQTDNIFPLFPSLYPLVIVVFLSFVRHPLIISIRTSEYYTAHSDSQLLAIHSLRYEQHIPYVQSLLLKILESKNIYQVEFKTESA